MTAGIEKILIATANTLEYSLDMLGQDKYIKNDELWTVYTHLIALRDLMHKEMVENNTTKEGK